MGGGESTEVGCVEEEASAVLRAAVVAGMVVIRHLRRDGMGHLVKTRGTIRTVTYTIHVGIQQLDLVETMGRFQGRMVDSWALVLVVDGMVVHPPERVIMGEGGNWERSAAEKMMDKDICFPVRRIIILACVAEDLCITDSHPDAVV